MISHLTGSSNKDSVMKLLTQIHHRLIPQTLNLGYVPYLSLIYLWIFFTGLYFYPPQGLQIAAVLVGVVTFLVCYFRVYWSSHSQLSFYIMAIVLIGVAMAEINWGASVFFVYAAVFCGVYDTKKSAYRALSLVVLFIIAYSWLTAKPPNFYLPSVLFSCVIGLMMSHQKEAERKNQALKISQQQIQTLAASAERERISRDLHDLLGHSLSVITLKSALASKMIDKNKPLEQINQEIKAVEQLSRETLALVRGAVNGYNHATIATELLQAKVATDAADIELVTAIESLSLAQETESQLALIIREAVTNVVRHAETAKVWVELKQHNQLITLSISDQGTTAQFNTNAGVENMRARIAKLQGHLVIQTQPHTQLLFTMPNNEQSGAMVC